MLTKGIGWLFGIDEATSIDRFQISFAAPWAESGPFWVFLGCVAAFLLGLWFYWKFQERLTPRYRLVFGSVRGILLALIVLMLADPILQITATNDPQPVIYTIFDGTESMAIIDQASSQIASSSQSTENQAIANENQEPLGARIDQLKEFLSSSDVNLLNQFQTENNIRIEPYLFDGLNTNTLRQLDVERNGSTEIFDASILAEQLSSSGKVTAIGDMFVDLSKGYRNSRLASVILFSDFANNSGLPPLGRSDQAHTSSIERIGVPIYTIGLGSVSALDLAVEVQPPPKMKKAERASVSVRINQTGLDGESATLRVVAQKIEGSRSVDEVAQKEYLVGTRQITLDSGVHYLDLPFTPEESGRFQFVAEVDPLVGEISLENNRSIRAVNIIDDYLRLMFVENEPTWEWRFIKEVFHRDKLVGMRGFRTFLRSADPKVRQTNELFLPTLTPKRSDFFANDVLFLGDMPGATLSERFCKMTKEFVGNFGGGLVVIAGPHYGPSELADSPLADMLPVKVSSGEMIRDTSPFQPTITPYGMQTEFMQLGSSEDARENQKAWENLGKLNWYQPVSGIHSQATVLMEHPFDTCADGKTPQPLIAMRRYGNGEVIYIAFNELWRLRRKHGELYYRQFWSQLINRLGLSHALGSQKRFVVRTDREKYLTEETAILSVEAYDENYEPLAAEDLNSTSLIAEILTPDESGNPTMVRQVSVPQLREGRFETKVSLYQEGQYQVRVLDPITNRQSEVRFQVTGVTAEMRNAVRNVKLQSEIARQSGGAAYELENANQLLKEIQLKDIREEFTTNTPLWATPFWFLLMIGLMLGEWFSRKVAHLA